MGSRVRGLAAFSHFDRVEYPLHSLILGDTLVIDHFLTPTLANAGTPLMWAGMLYMAFGNAIIGLLEGVILFWLFKAKPGRSIILLILANYLSAWLGMQFLKHGLVALVPSPDINDIQKLFTIAILTTFGITLLAELPFIMLTFAGAPKWFSKAIKGTLLTQTVSYICMFSCFYSASGTSLYTGPTVVALEEFGLPEDMHLYYIDANDGDVYTRLLNVSSDTLVYDLNSVNNIYGDYLTVLPSKANPDGVDLMAQLMGANTRDFTWITVKKDFALDAAINSQWDDNRGAEYIQGTWFSFGPVAQMKAAKDSPWSFYVGFWPIEGFSAKNTDTDERIHRSLETPVVSWPVRCATQINRNTIIFQLGDDQICIYNVEKDQIALVAKGRSPVVAIGRPINHETYELTFPQIMHVP